jgi:hypothetical protein
MFHARPGLLYRGHAVFQVHDFDELGFTRHNDKTLPLMNTDDTDQFGISRIAGITRGRRYRLKGMAAFGLAFQITAITRDHGDSGDLRLWLIITIWTKSYLRHCFYEHEANR